MDKCFKNCSNCKHRDKFINEEPCFICKYTEEWEPREDDNNDKNTNHDTV